MNRPGRSKSSSKLRDANYLKVVAKTFWLLEAVAAGGTGSRLSDLSRLLRMPKATVYRILYTLSKLGYAKQDPQTEIYHLTGKIARLSRGDSAKETLRGLARPFMERLLGTFEQAVNLALLQNGQILYVELLEGLRPIRMAATVGTFQPIHCTALGKSIAAFLERRELEEILRSNLFTAFTSRTITSAPVLLKRLGYVRRNGYAVDNEETERGLRCVAAPIFDIDGKPLAAISVSGPTSHIRGDRIREIGAALKEATKEISAQLGFGGPGSERIGGANGTRK